MYLDHFGLAEPPFRITPHTEFFFSGANRGSTLDALLYAATHDEGIIKISGEVGSGKTMLCRVLMERMPEQVAIVYLSNPSLSRDDIFYAIADELALTLPENARASAVLKLLQNHLISLHAEGRRVVVLIDEAHAMPAETLEQIRLLSNLETNHNKLLQLVLFGQPELNDILARADMRQLKERITHNFMLEPLVRDDVAEYMEFRMRAAGYKGPNVFSPAANRLIHDASRGLTRRINILADKSLLAAFASGTHQITIKEVRAAIRDCDFSTATAARRPSRKWLLAGALAIGFVIIAAAATTYLALGASAAAPPSGATPAPPVVPISATPNAAVTAPVATPPAEKPALLPLSPIPSPTRGEGSAASRSTASSLAEQALDRGKTWLATAPDERWFLQLYAVDADQAGNVESYLRRLGETVDREAIHAYRSDLSGKMRYGVIYGDYATLAAAWAAAGNLPAWVQVTHPYPRQVRRLR
ncbi:ATPase [Georgfuchsia toluolica]|uniref:ATPase n=1 Tax=Georgfuchsia toluolica TaxID=424218 RepID=A0A916N2S7_9PROT|nr:AAA family ATPase [Georgfuchsia toluolica]CAG4884244.1 ATPase [Georgfuchsia toluolica]